MIARPHSYMNATRDIDMIISPSNVSLYSKYTVRLQGRSGSRALVL